MRFLDKKIFLTIGLFSLLALIPMSCGLFCQDSCGCGPISPPQNLLIKSMRLNTVDPLGQAVNPLDSFPYDKVFKSLEVKDFEITVVSEIIGPSTTFGMTYACSPLPISSKDEIIGIKIRNKKEVTLGSGVVLKPEEDISSYFGISFFYSNNLVKIQEFIGSGRSFVLGENFKLGFFQAPGQPISLEFDLEVNFKSGVKFLFENQALTLR
jgi:hypothetical protein